MLLYLLTCLPSPAAPCPPPPVTQRVDPQAVQTLRQVVHDIAVKEGVAGLFKGALPSILKAAPSAAVTFAVRALLLVGLLLSAGANTSVCHAPELRLSPPPTNSHPSSSSADCPPQAYDFFLQLLTARAQQEAAKRAGEGGQAQAAAPASKAAPRRPLH